MCSYSDRLLVKHPDVGVAIPSAAEFGCHHLRSESLRYAVGRTCWLQGSFDRKVYRNLSEHEQASVIARILYWPRVGRCPFFRFPERGMERREAPGACEAP